MINNKKIIGVCLSKVHDEFRTAYICELHRFANECGYKMIVFNSLRDLFFGDLNDEGSSRIFDVINYNVLDALVILDESIHKKEIVEDVISKAQEHDVPVILVHGQHEGCCCINPDYTSAYRKVIEHIIEVHGAKSFIFMRGLRDGSDPDSEKRLAIVREVLGEHGLSLPDSNVLYGDYWDVPAKIALQEYLKSGRSLPDVMISANDSMAMALCEELEAQGYRVPDDVKVIGFDGIVSAEYFLPRLTTCREDVPHLAELTIKLVSGSIAGEVRPGEFMETYMPYIGESCGCVNAAPVDFRSRANTLYRMNQEMQQHEGHIYSFADRILDSENLNTLSAVLKHYILPNSSVCLNENFIMTALSRTGEKPSVQQFNELIVITAMAEDFTSGRQGRFPVTDMVPDLEQWLEDSTLCILTPIFMNNESCGYYAVRTDNALSTTHKIFRVSKIMNIAFGALINRLTNKNIQNSIKNAKLIDPLSGLANLKGLSKWFNDFSAVEENHRKTIMVSIYNIPQYKFIYENYGIEDIEGVVRFVADALSLANKDNGFIARTGDDEFIVVNYVNSEAEVPVVIDNAVSVFYGIIEGYNTSSDKDYFVEVNCGCTVANPGWNSSLRSFIKLANAEMYMNKLKAGLTPVMKDDKAAENARTAKELYNQFTILVDKNLFHYFFQPIIDAKTGDIYAYEALMRTKDGIKMSPLEILNVAEEYNRLYDIEKATLFNVMERYAQDTEMFAGAKVFINTIPGNFLGKKDLDDLVERYGKYMSNFVFEITEQDTVSDDELTAIRSLGSFSGEEQEGRIAVDDYGTGHSNIVNLLRYEPHIIKIDRFLISNIQNDQNKQMFVKSTIEFARMNNIKVLAEGVETYEEMKTVIDYGVDLIQGFYTARPAPDPIGELPHNIREEIIKENIVASRFGSDLEYYIVNGDETVNLYKLALDKYGFIVVRSGNVKFVGTRDFAVEIPIITDDDSTANITFENVCLRSADESAVRIGKNSRVTLNLEGTNTLLKNGISVPESSSLTFRGDGTLKVSLKTNGGTGIGSSYDGTFGSISFEQTGTVTVELFIDRGVGIGGGIQGEDSVIRFVSGHTVINSQCVESLGIGSVRGKSIIQVESGADVVSHCSGKSAVALGSVDGDMEIDSCGKLDLQADGELCTSLGTLYKGNAVIKITGGDTSAVVHGDTAVCVGSIQGTTDITCDGGRVNAYGEGDSVTGYGSSDGTGITRITAGTVLVKILSGNIRQFGTSCRTIITGGNIIPAQKDQVNAVNMFGQHLHCEKLANSESRFERKFFSGDDEYTYIAKRERPEDEFCVYVP